MHDSGKKPANGAARPACGPPLSRRALVAGTIATAGIAALPWAKRSFAPTSTVFVARHQRYDGPLAQTIRDGLLATGVKPGELLGKRVLLKPNLVEPSPLAPQLTTHPAVVAAAALVFRDWGATVVVGEGPGHLRDTQLALEASGVAEVLDAENLPFADLNYEEVEWAPNRGRASKLTGFWLPRSVVQADFVVSLPKMKTHHWVGMTGALKNFYGVIPGCVYGWPKNVLHHAGIPQTIFDINASLPRTLTIVDGILAMEGDGPIMGSPKPMGLLVMGGNLTAVDATLARIMGLAPARISYLQLAAGRLGPIEERQIRQRGESWQSVASAFQILDRPHLAPLRVQPGELVT